MTKELTALQESFLDKLFGDAKGDYRKAANLAGYSPTAKVNDIVRSLREEILDRARDLLVANAALGIEGLLDVVSKPNQMGGKIKLEALKEVLDRAGVQKIDKSEVSVKAEGGIFILPPKDK